jgi:hypothetical protein
LRGKPPFQAYMETVLNSPQVTKKIQAAQRRCSQGLKEIIRFMKGFKVVVKILHTMDASIEAPRKTNMMQCLIAAVLHCRFR